MQQHKLSHIPLTNYLENPYAARMLAVASALEMPIGVANQALLIERAPREAIRDILEAAPIRSKTFAGLVARGMVNPDEFNEFAPTIAALGGWDNDCFDVRPIDLASPILRQSTIEALLPTAPPHAVAALKANPNCPQECQGADGMSAVEILYYSQAMAKHGDLGNARNVKFLEKIVKELPVTLDSEDYGSDGDTHYLTRKYLAGRHDLPENLARLLDTKLPASDYFTLAQTPIHQELVRNGVLTGDNIDLDGPREGTLILSPVIREERLIALMDTIDELPGDYDSELVATTIAAHPNAPEEMLHNAMGAAMHSELPIMLIEGNNPKALPLLQRLVEENSLRPEDIAIYKPATPELLQWAAERLMATNTNASGLSDLASHPSFPWKALPLEKMVDYVTEKQSLSIHVSAALAGAMTPADAKRVVEGDDRAAIVFDPRTSGHRLEQLARKSPGLAALVALHPNATTSIDEYVPKGARPLVEKLRGSPEVERLPGRSIGSHEREITPLHI